MDKFSTTGWRPRSALAARAPVGRAAGLANLADEAATTPAGLPGSVIDGAVDLEAAGATVAVHVVADAAAAGSDGVGERLAHRLGETLATPGGNAIGRAQRRNTGAKQALRCINVANADHEMAVHQHRLDRSPAPAQGRVQPVAGESVVKRLDAEHGKQRGRRLAGFLPEHDAEAPRVGKAQHVPGEEQVDVVVAACRRTLGDEAQATRHAEMNDQRATRRPSPAVEQEVLAAPAHGIDPLPGENPVQAFGDRQAQARDTHDGAEQDSALDPGLHAPAANLDFRQLGHRLSPCPIPNNIPNFADSIRSNSFAVTPMQRMPTKLLVTLLVLGLAAPGFAAGETPSRPAARKPVPPRPAPVELTAPADEDTLARNVFQALVGDLALRRNDPQMAIAAWADLAQRTRDPKVIARAIEVAASARQFDLALELNRMWLEIEPESKTARQTETSLLLLTNRLDDLAPQLSRMLEQDKANLPANLMHLNRMLARHSDKKAVQQLVDRVASPYADLPEAHFAMGQAAAGDNEMLRALAEFDKALQLRPNWEAAALARAATQAQSSTRDAAAGLATFLKANPESRDARLTYARLLVSESRYDDARREFERLLKENPDNPDFLYPLAMLHLQLNDPKAARPLLEKLLTTDMADKSTVHYFLGQLADDEKRQDDALAEYRQVTSGERVVAARARAAKILLAQGRDAEAREMLRSAVGGGPERIEFIVAEAQMLREAGRLDESWQLLEGALARHPDNPDLLYDAALLAERRGDSALMEKYLRRVLELKADHAHALNALGYSFADRNMRLPEARDLVARALALAPGDAFIMDSMGWVLYREGKLDEARAVLEKAYGLRDDPEIAAHLGEVLWSLGRKDDATRLLKAAARKHPDNEVLAAAVKKFAP